MEDQLNLKIEPRDASIRNIVDKIIKSDTPNPTYDIIRGISVKAVEMQENIIMSTIQTIGGTTYADITIDKNKVIDMLRKYTARKILHMTCRDGENPCFIIDRYTCPTCGELIYKELSYCGTMKNHIGMKNDYCRFCGQKLDWSEKEEENEKEASDCPIMPRDLVTKLCKDVHAKVIEDIKKAGMHPMHINLAAIKTFSKTLNDFAEKEAAKARAEKLEKETGWIATADKMPTEDGDYLVYDPFTGSSYVYEFSVDSISDTRYWKNNITLWMPVPELPKKEV